MNIRIAFNPHKPAPCKYGSRRAAIDAAIAADFVPTQQEAIDAIRASKCVKHLQFQKPQEIKIRFCDKMARLSSKMYADFIMGDDKPMELLTIPPIKIWILCAIHRGIKMGFL